MDKFDIIKKIASSHGLPDSRSEMIVNIIIEKMTDTLKREGELKLNEFGSFKVRSQSQYSGTFTETKIFPKREVSFSPEKACLEIINS